MKIGIMVSWFGKDIISNINSAGECKVDGIQLTALDELHPQNITENKLKEIKTVIDRNNLEVSAFCAEIGGHGLEISSKNEENIAYIKDSIYLAKEFDSNIITSHIGIIPEDKNCDRYKNLLEACQKIGEYASKFDSYFAIETGPETIERLSSFVDECNTHNDAIRINYDPANLVMVTCDDEVEGVKRAGKRIVHTHAKDGICYKKVGCDYVYNIFAEGGIEEISKLTEYFEETRLGHGSVRWSKYVEQLRNIGYEGYLTVEHESKINAFDEIEEAVTFLKELLRR